MTDQSPAAALPGPLFSPGEGAGYDAAAIARGPWDARMMHGGAPSALLARAVEHAEGGEGMVVARLTMEFLAGVPLGPVAVEATVAKPGRRFQLVEATLEAGGRPVCLARAVRLRRDDDPGADAAGPYPCPVLPGPETGPDLPPFVDSTDEMFYPDAMEIRHVAGERGSGAVAAWFRMRGELVAGEAPAPLARAMAAADFTNGISSILPWDEWTFVNTDLTVHLHREPEGEWIGLDARTSVSRAATGVASGVLHDRHGPIGTCAQTLFVQRRA